MIVDIMYVVLFTVLYRCSNYVVKNGLHVSSLWECHRGDAHVMCSSHIEGLCITNVKSVNERQRKEYDLLIAMWYSSEESVRL
jgi:hypothetical protein